MKLFLAGINISENYKLAKICKNEYPLLKVTLR